jgi:hypothetical protein
MTELTRREDEFLLYQTETARRASRSASMARRRGCRSVRCPTSSRLKRAGGGKYFDELLARIRDVRSSEKVFWRKVLDIYATSIDYDPRVEAPQGFFKTVQNKMHWAAHGDTAAEIVATRADAARRTWTSRAWLVISACLNQILIPLISTL